MLIINVQNKFHNKKFHKASEIGKCTIKMFMGGRGGGWGGGSSDGCLKWSGGGSLRDLSKNIFKQGVGKGKSCSQGKGGLKVSPPLPPGKF